MEPGRGVGGRAPGEGGEKEGSRGCERLPSWTEEPWWSCFQGTGQGGGSAGEQSGCLRSEGIQTSPVCGAGGTCQVAACQQPPLLLPSSRPHRRTPDAGRSDTLVSKRPNRNRI